MADTGAQRSKAGLHELLLSNVRTLREHIAKKIPPRFQAVISTDDILQEVWLSAYRTYPDFRPEGPNAVSRWLMTLATTKLVSAMRAARSLKRGGNQSFTCDAERRDTSCATLFASLRSPEKTPSRHAHSAEVGHMVMILLNELKDEQRRALELRYVEGLSPPDIAQAMGKSEQAVNSLLFNARRQLRQLLGSASRYFSDVPSCAEKIR